MGSAGSVVLNFFSLSKFLMIDIFFSFFSLTHVYTSVSVDYSVV